jgi:hypothetical protein
MTPSSNTLPALCVSTSTVTPHTCRNLMPEVPPVATSLSALSQPIILIHHRQQQHHHFIMAPSTLSAALAALFHNACDATPLRTMLIERGHPQAATSIQTDNACASGIANKTVKHRCSKAIDVYFYWICDSQARAIRYPLAKRSRKSCGLFHKTSLAHSQQYHALALFT